MSWARLKFLYISTAIILLNLIVMFMVGETLFRIVESIWHHSHSVWTGDNHIDSNVARLYAHYPWGPAFHDEMERTHFAVRYEPFEEYRLRPLNQKFVHIGADGFRVHPGLPPSPDKSVVVLGGSTALGEGSPDSESIPAHLQILFNEHVKEPVSVLNHGTPGWVQNQEIVHLIGEIKRGHRPDVAIFYDGVNDVGCTAYQGVPGSTEYYWQLVDFFEGNNDLTNLLATRQEWPGSHLAHAVLNTLRKFTHVPIPFIPFLEKPFYAKAVDFKDNRYPKLSSMERHHLAQQTFNLYLQNVHMVKRLAKAYDFEAYFFWQPSICTAAPHKPLTDFEKTLWSENEKTPFCEQSEMVTDLVRQHSDEIQDLSQSTDKVAETVFIDPVHTMPVGNQVIAERIFKTIRHESPSK